MNLVKDCPLSGKEQALLHSAGGCMKKISGPMAIDIEHIFKLKVASFTGSGFMLMLNL